MSSHHERVSDGADRFRLSQPAFLLASGAVALIAGVLGAVALLDNPDPGIIGALFVFFVGLASLVVWVPAATWFREREVSLGVALVLGAASSFLGLLPLSVLVGAVIWSHLPVCIGMGVVTALLVHHFATARQHGSSHTAV